VPVKNKTPAPRGAEVLCKAFPSGLHQNLILLACRMQWLAVAHALPPETAAIVADHVSGGGND